MGVSSVAPPKNITEARRNRVAFLMVRGFSERRIAALLAEGVLDKRGNIQHQFLNPKTKEPFSNTTIHNDIVKIRDEWRKENMASVEEHQARQMQEIQTVKELAWTKQDPTLALRAIDLEMKLLGTNAPRRIDMNVSINYKLVVELVEAIEGAGDDHERVFNRMIEKARERALVDG